MPVSIDSQLKPIPLLFCNKLEKKGIPSFFRRTFTDLYLAATHVSHKKPDGYHLRFPKGGDQVKNGTEFCLYICYYVEF